MLLAEPQGIRGAAIMALLLVSSGCTGASTPSSGLAPSEEETAEEAMVNEFQGAIEGVVLDVSLFPVVNATVNLTDAGRDKTLIAATLSREDGRFVFSLLDPGTYVMASDAAGFERGSMVVQVLPGEVTKARLLLGDRAGQEPYVVLFIKSAIMECASSLIVTGFSPGSCTGDINFTKTWGYYDIPDGFRAIMVEVTWKSADYMRLDAYVNESSSTQWPMRMVWGQAPLRFPLVAGVLYPAPGPSAPGLGPPPPVPTSKFRLLAAPDYYGNLQKEINQTAGPVCGPHPLGHCSGLGITLSLRVTNYVSAFVHDAPTDLSRYSAIPDS